MNVRNRPSETFFNSPKVLLSRVCLLLLPRDAPQQKRERVAHLRVHKARVIQDAPVGGETGLVGLDRPAREKLPCPLRAGGLKVAKESQGQRPVDLGCVKGTLADYWKASRCCRCFTRVELVIPSDRESQRWAVALMVKPRRGMAPRVPICRAAEALVVGEHRG